MGSTSNHTDASPGRKRRRPARLLCAALALALCCALAPSANAAAPVLLDSWGGPGTATGQFDNPLGVAVAPGGSVYVADTNNNRVQQFTGGGEFIRQWGTPGNGNGEFNKPVGVETDATGDVFVVESAGNRIQRFSPTGVYQEEWGSFGGAAGEFNFPIDLALGGAGDVFVADLDNRVQRFDRDGGFLDEFGTTGSGPGQFSNPSGIAADSTGVYVADTGNGRVQIFALNGIPQGEFGDSPGPGALPSPFGIDDGPGGELAVTEDNANRVKLFSSAGALRESFGTELSGTSDVAYGPGAIYVTDTGSDRIFKYSTDSVAPRLKIKGRKLKLNRKGVMKAKLSCPASEVSGPCSGKLKLEPQKKIGGKRPTLAKGAYEIDSGSTDKVKLKAKGRGLKLLRKSAKARKAKASTRVSDAAGNTRNVARKVKVVTP